MTLCIVCNEAFTPTYGTCEGCGGDGESERGVLKITIVQDPDTNECMYVSDGKGKQHITAIDIADAAKGRPFTLEVKSIDWYHEQWPETLSDALRKPRV